MKKSTNRFEEKARELKAFGELYRYAEAQMDCHRDVRRNEEGEILKDEDDNWLYEDPAEDSYNYAEWAGWKAVLRRLDDIKI